MRSPILVGLSHLASRYLKDKSAVFNFLQFVRQARFYEWELFEDIHSSTAVQYQSLNPGCINDDTLRIPAASACVSMLIR